MFTVGFTTKDGAQNISRHVSIKLIIRLFASHMESGQTWHGFRCPKRYFASNFFNIIHTGYEMKLQQGNKYNFYN
jgi:hypothetical protein